MADELADLVRLIAREAGANRVVALANLITKIAEVLDEPTESQPEPRCLSPGPVAPREPASARRQPVRQVRRRASPKKKPEQEAPRLGDQLAGLLATAEGALSQRSLAEQVGRSVNVTASALSYLERERPPRAERTSTGLWRATPASGVAGEAARQAQVRR